MDSPLGENAILTMAVERKKSFQTVSKVFSYLVKVFLVSYSSRVLSTMTTHTLSTPLLHNLQ